MGTPPEHLFRVCGFVVVALARHQNPDLWAAKRNVNRQAFAFVVTCNCFLLIAVCVRCVNLVLHHRAAFAGEKNRARIWNGNAGSAFRYAYNRDFFWISKFYGNTKRLPQGKLVDSCEIRKRNLVNRNYQVQYYDLATRGGKKLILCNAFVPFSRVYLTIRPITSIIPAENTRYYA